MIERIGEGIVPSLSLAVPAFAVETILAVSLALFCAFYRGGLLDRVVILLTVAAVSIPSLAYILFGQYFLAYRWNLFPIFGYESLPAGWLFLALPAVIWVLLSLGSEVALLPRGDARGDGAGLRADGRGEGPLGQPHPVPPRAEELDDPDHHAGRSSRSPR